MYEPSRRGGVRGGKDQFKWTEVITDKERDNYLGQTEATIPLWWNSREVAVESASKLSKDQTAKAKIKSEIETLKEQERILREEALGIRTRESHTDWDTGGRLAEEEIHEITKRGRTERDPVQEESSIIQGVGFESVRSMQGSGYRTRKSEEKVVGGKVFERESSDEEDAWVEKATVERLLKPPKKRRESEKRKEERRESHQSERRRRHHKTVHSDERRRKERRRRHH